MGDNPAPAPQPVPPADAPEYAAARAYFTALDQANTDAAPRAVRQASRFTAPLLQNRLVRRVCDGPFAPLDTIPAEHIAAIRAFMDDLLLRHLHNDPARLARAMELFANGALRWQTPAGVWHTQPSSGWYFLFGEFALLAYEHRPDNVWLSAARAMVATQEVFMAAYGRAPGRRGLLAYDNELYLGPVGDPHLACIRMRYAPYGYRDLLIQSTMNAVSAFPDLRQP